MIELEGAPAPEGRAERARFVWDAAGRLARVDRTDARGRRAVVRYGWSDDGRLASRTGPGGDARTIELGLVRAELREHGWTRVHVLDPDAPREPPLAYVDLHPDWTPAWTYLHDDGQGAVLALSDERALLVGQVDLSPWGEVQADAGEDAPVFWRGQEVDRDAGLVLLDGRPYAPALGRFLAPDPVARGAPAYLGPVSHTPGLVGALEAPP